MENNNTVPVTADSSLISMDRNMNNMSLSSSNSSISMNGGSFDKKWIVYALVLIALIFAGYFAYNKFVKTVEPEGVDENIEEGFAQVN